MTRVRLRNVVTNVVAKSAGEPQPFVGLEDVASRTGRPAAVEFLQKAASDSLDFRCGDVLFGKLRPYLAKSLVVDFSGTCSSEFLVLRPLEEVDSRFLHYLTLSSPWLEWAEATAYGSKMPRTSWEAMSDLRLDLPPLTEQRRIADFLDTETTRLDHLVALRQQQLALLGGRRWSHFESLVAESGPPSVPVRRTLLRLTDGPFGSAFSSSDYTAEGAAVVRLGNIGFAEYRAENQARIPVTLYEQFRRHRVHCGDLLIAGLGDAANHAGRACVAPALGAAIVKGKCFAAAVDNTVADARYLALLFSSPVGRSTFETRGSTRQMINLEIVKSARIPLPSRPVQGAIVEESLHAEQLRKAAGVAITMSVELLRERRQALITAAVTGQLDVTTAHGGAA